MNVYSTDINIVTAVQIEAKTEEEARVIAQDLVEESQEFHLRPIKRLPKTVTGAEIGTVLKIEHNYSDFTMPGTKVKAENGIYYSQSADEFYFVAPSCGYDTAYTMSGNSLQVRDLPDDIEKQDGKINIVDMFRSKPFRMRAADFGTYYGYQLVLEEPDADGVMHVFEIYVRKGTNAIPVSTGDWFCAYDTFQGDQDLVAFPDRLVVEQA